MRPSPKGFVDIASLPISDSQSHLSAVQQQQQAMPRANVSLMTRTKTHRRGIPITREQRALIREQAREGKTRKEIAEYMSCGEKTVRRAIVNNFKPKDNLDEDADYLLGRKGGLMFIDDDAITPEPQDDIAEVKGEREDADIRSMSDWSPTPDDPNDLPYISNAHEDTDRAEARDKDMTTVLRQSARLRGLKVQDYLLPTDRERNRLANSDHDESVEDAINGDITSQSNNKRACRSNEGDRLSPAIEVDTETEELPEPSTSQPIQSGRTQNPSEKAKAVRFNLRLVEMRRAIQQRRALGISANQPTVASTSRSTGAASSSSSSSSRTTIAPTQAPRNSSDKNVPAPTRVQTVSSNKPLSRDAAIKILHDLGLNEMHADIVIATGIKSADHLKGMADFPEKLLHFIKTDVSEQGFSKWDYFELLSALWRRRDSGWEGT